MRTDPSLAVMFHAPALRSGVRRISKATKALLAVLTVALVSFGTSARAADGPYVGIGGSLSLLDDSDVTAPGGGPYTPLNVSAPTENGFAVRGMAGYAFPNGFRVEGEIDYRKHDAEVLHVKDPGSLVELAAGGRYAALPPATQAAIRQGTTGSQAIDGDFSMLAFMANVDYDLDIGSAWTPYVGGGIGLATIALDAESARGSLVDDDDLVFAYQVGTGLGYEFALPEGRSLTVSLDWRYFGTETPTFKGDVTGGDFDATINGHDIGISLMYGF